MKNILNTLGLENEVIDLGVKAPTDEFSEDMQEMSAFCDLQETLIANSLTASLEDVEAVKSAITMKIGVENRTEFGNMIGLESAGMEAAVDVMARQFYRVKTAIKVAIRAIIAFAKKIVGLSAPTEKAFKAVKAKAKTYSKKWSKAIGSLKLTKAKETRLEEAGKALKSEKADLQSTDPTKAGVILVTAINAIKDVNTLSELITKIGNVSNLGTTESNKETLKTLKEKNKDTMETINSKTELEPSVIKTTIGTALADIEVICNAFIEKKLAKKLEKITKNLEKVQKEISKSTQADVEAMLTSKSSSQSYEELIKQVAVATEIMTTLPVSYGLAVKADVQICQIVFTEIDKVLSMNEITDKKND